MGSVYRRSGRSKSLTPEALAARLPAELRSMDGFPSPSDYLGAVGDWMARLGVPMPTFEEALRGAERPVSPSDVATAAGVPAVQAAWRHRLTATPEERAARRLDAESTPAATAPVAEDEPQDFDPEDLALVSADEPPPRPGALVFAVDMPKPERRIWRNGSLELL